MANVHKDFHGALSYGLAFLEEKYGAEARTQFLARLADTVYKPLADDLRVRGVVALREHWARIFELEGGAIEMHEDGDTLVLHVHRCPAITHMQEQGYRIADHFCEHTRIVNEAVCRAAGYEATVDYDQAAGRCVQRFRRIAA
ncbi:MAG: hypothetical protein ACLFTT_18000 [Candidatus Hydrogenedentota bacterium]